MSYYSNVRVNVEASAFEPFKKCLMDYLKQNDLQDCYPFDNPKDKLDVFFESKDHVYFGWDEYNLWDVDDSETDLSTGVMRALKQIESEDFAFSYVREGEDVYDGDVDSYATCNKNGEYVESPSIRIGFDDKYLAN